MRTLRIAARRGAMWLEATYFSSELDDARVNEPRAIAVRTSRGGNRQDP
jgi:hypothetical protein